VLLNSGIEAYLGYSRIPQCFETRIWRLMDGHADGAGAVATALTSASKEALLPQIGQAPHLVSRQARLPRGLVPCFNTAARASCRLFPPAAETALMET
jgi:hypothetical protein